MKRYNFDKIPRKAAGFGVHANSKKQAWGLVYALAKGYDYNGALVFRDNMKCPDRDGYDRGYKCTECYKR